MSSIEGMDTPEELTEAFDTPKAFEDLMPAEIIARFEYIATRQSAEFLLYLVGLELEPEQLAKIFGAFEYAQADFRDFMTVGLPCEDVDFHPMMAPIYQLVDRATDGIGYAAQSADDEFLDTGEGYEHLGVETEEQLLHKLEGVIKRYPSD